jgi:hypothetical protein
VRHLRLFCLLALAVAASGIPAAYAQTRFHARPVGSYDGRGVMFRLHKIADPKDVAGCERLVLVGIVESAEHNDRKEIVSFSLKARNGGARTVNLSTSLYPQLPVEAEIGLSKLLSKGRRVRVVAYSCAASPDALEADEIRALSPAAKPDGRLRNV